MANHGRDVASRRVFLRRAGTTALAAAAAGGVMSSAGSVQAATPTLSAEGMLDFGPEFLESYGKLVDLIDGWCGSTGDPVVALIRLQVVRAYVDEYCGTYPKRPWPWPWPPRFEELERYLDGFETLAEEIVGWCGNEPRPLPGGIAVGVLLDDLDDWCGTRPRPWPRPRGLVQEFGF